MTAINPESENTSDKIIDITSSSSKGGQNPPNTSSKRPKPPSGSNGPKAKKKVVKKKTKATGRKSSILDKLSPNDIAELAKLIGSAIMSTKLPEPTAEVETITETKEPKKRGRPKKIQNVEEVEENLDDSVDDDDDELLTNPKAKVVPRIKKIATLDSKQGSDKGRQTRTEPLGKFRNDFNKTRFAKALKNESKTDKLLWGDNEPVERDRVSQCIIDCQRCGRECKVAMSMVFQNPETREYQFICNKCVGG